MSVAPIRQLKTQVGGTVSYYDGTTLLGKKNVPTGKDVLHPSITMPSKSGYTFVGWSTSSSPSDWVNTLVATGEAMTLYAVYAANSLSISSETSPYISGTMFIRATSYGGAVPVSGSFNLNKKWYQSAVASISTSGSESNVGRFDGVDYSGSAQVTIQNGNHELYIFIFPNDHYEWKEMGVTVTLTSPTAWT